MQQANEDVHKNENGKREEKLTVNHAHSLPGHTGFITIAVLPPSYACKKREKKTQNVQYGDSSERTLQVTNLRLDSL